MRDGLVSRLRCLLEQITLNPEDPDIFLHDDFMHYINDTLNWIPTLTASSSGLIQEKGLNLYGRTVINFNGAGKLYKIMNAWTNLLCESPQKVMLTGLDRRI